jgi:hypothetical protein
MESHPLLNSESWGVNADFGLTRLWQLCRDSSDPRISCPNCTNTTSGIRSAGHLRFGAWVIHRSAPTADDVGHAEWLDEVDTREKTFVMLNRDDHVLQRATDARPAGAHALGLGTTHPLAQHATYVDISRMGRTGEKDEDHEVFGKGAMNQQILLCQFFTQALTGQTVVLDPATNVDSVERGVVHRLRDKREAGAPCLKVPELP